MSYLKNKVLGNNETIMIEPVKNPLSLIITWVFAVLFFWLLLIPIIIAIAKTIKFCHTEYLITDNRVIEKKGWISTVTDEMSFYKIENVTVKYSFWGKIFNYGTISFQGANSNNITFLKIKDAAMINKRFKELI